MYINLTMNIYALKGHKVKCEKVTSPSNYDEEIARKYLEVGKVYTVEKTQVNSSSTSVELQEFPGVEFNSTMFDDVEKQAPEEDKKHPDYSKYH